MFSLQRRTVTLDGQDVILVELSAGDFADLSSEADDNKQGIMMIARSIESPAVTEEDVASWPRRVTEELLNNIVDLNGFSDEGN
tara:strand:+ start:5112 stop:5363 length:252 start_codon:yes stop_codon:yes gene_type:complete